MYKLVPLDETRNGFYCAWRMRAAPYTPYVQSFLSLLLAGLVSLQCKAKNTPAAPPESDLHVEILSWDTSFAVRDDRPFIAGEQARMTLKVEGGVPPYDLQLATSLGEPTLANGSTRIESTTAGASEVAMDLKLASEVPSGSYGLVLRVSDSEGVAASVLSEPFEVIGKDAPEASLDLGRAHLQIVDVAGRRRASFYQGEQIQIRALAASGTRVMVGIFASDDRPFMPMQEYEVKETHFELSLQIPSMARVGEYRVHFAGPDLQASAALHVTGVRFSPARTPVLEKLALRGGPDFRVPRGAVLKRGEALRIEARVGGIQQQAKAILRLRSRTGQVVSHAELGALVPNDPHPAARLLLGAEWTPGPDLPSGRHVLEIEISEADELATLYREIVLQ